MLGELLTLIRILTKLNNFEIDPSGKSSSVLRDLVENVRWKYVLMKNANGLMWCQLVALASLKYCVGSKEYLKKFLLHA